MHLNMYSRRKKHFQDKNIEAGLGLMQLKMNLLVLSAVIFHFNNRMNLDYMQTI